MIRRPVVLGLWLGVAMACSNADVPPTAIVAADSADQIHFNLVHNLTIDGVRRVILEADTAYFYMREQTAEMIGVTVRFYSPEGIHTSTVTSLEGTYNWGDQSMEARRNVVAVTPDDRRLTTDTLRYNRNQNEISGPSSFLFCAPDRQLEGDAFVSDPEFRRVETTRPRRGQIGDVACR